MAVEPITQRQVLSYAYTRPGYFRNGPREAAWGGTVYFNPSDTPVGQSGYGGPGYSSGQTGNCTWWAWGRCLEMNGVALPFYGNATNWYSTYSGNKDGGPSVQNPGVGDILCWGTRSDGVPGHLQVIEVINGDTLTVSESYDGVASNTACVVQSISKSNPHYGSISFPYQGIIHTGGGGGGGGHWVTKSYDYTSHWGGAWEYNGTHNLYGGDDGTQDNPYAPMPSLVADRQNNRWEPINCRTEERTLTYDANGNLVWSEWVETKNVANNVPVSQYDLPGWDLEWPED